MMNFFIPMQGVLLIFALGMIWGWNLHRRMRGESFTKGKPKINYVDIEAKYKYK